MIRVVYKKPGLPAEIRNIENELGTLQEMVDGHIETIGYLKNVVLICNEEGKLRGMERNFNISPFDTIVGPAIFAGTEDDGLASLDERTAVELFSLYGGDLDE